MCAGEYLLRGHEGAGSSGQSVEGAVVSVWFAGDDSLVVGGEGRQQPGLWDQPPASAEWMNDLESE